MAFKLPVAVPFKSRLKDAGETVTDETVGVEPDDVTVTYTYAETLESATDVIVTMSLPAPTAVILPLELTETTSLLPEYVEKITE